MNKLKYMGYSSGRLSSKSVNLQQIPKNVVRTEFKSKDENLITIWDIGPAPDGMGQESRVLTFKPKSDDTN